MSKASLKRRGGICIFVDEENIGEKEQLNYGEAITAIDLNAVAPMKSSKCCYCGSIIKSDVSTEKASNKAIGKFNSNGRGSWFERTKLKYAFRKRRQQPSGGRCQCGALGEFACHKAFHKCHNNIIIIVNSLTTINDNNNKNNNNTNINVLKTYLDAKNTKQNRLPHSGFRCLLTDLTAPVSQKMHLSNLRICIYPFSSTQSL